jgi:DNA polymerase elongation subunit (family B)
MLKSYTNVERYRNYEEDQHYILHRYVTNNNELKKEVVVYKPTMFERCPAGAYTDLVTNESMKKIVFNDMKEADWKIKTQIYQPLSLQEIFIELIDGQYSEEDIIKKFEKLYYTKYDKTANKPTNKTLNKIEHAILAYEKMIELPRNKRYNFILDSKLEGLQVSLSGNTKFEIQFINDTYKNIDLSQSKKDISVGIIDIEVDVPKDAGFPHPSIQSGDVWIPTANYPINAITLLHCDSSTYYVFALGDKWEHNRDDVEFNSYETEEELLKDFIYIWNQCDLNVISGWNSYKFDLPYIYHRLNRLFDSKEAGNVLSPWYGYCENGIAPITDTIKSKSSKDGYGRPFAYIEILGITQMDYMILYKKFTFKEQERYSLNHISYVELDEKKIDYSEHDNLYNLYRNDYAKFVEYNVKDVELIERLDDKLGLIDIALTITMMAKSRHADYDTSLSPITSWIFSDLVDNKIVMPPKRNTHRGDLVGGYVSDPIVGRHEYVGSFDLNSLYPSIIRSLNLSPETKRHTIPNITVNSWLKNGHKSLKDDVLLPEQLSVSANGLTFDTSKPGVFPKLTKGLYETRSSEKNKMIKCQRLIADIDAELEKRK